MAKMEISIGELNKNSNLPKGRQIFIKDENKHDLAVLFNWEKDIKDFKTKEKELKELAKLFLLSPKMKEAIIKCVQDFHNGNVGNNPTTETRSLLIELAKLLTQ